MRRIAVFLATTTGPVRVERITRERAPQSMVCLKRTSTILPISAAYDSFVRPGSGVIERVFGPFEAGAFRLDLSQAIETGQSWQLGVFLAHAIAADPAQLELSEADDAAEIVWLTGQVDYDLAVGSVRHIAEKVHASTAPLRQWLVAGKPVTMFVCEGEDFARAQDAGLPQGVRLLPVHRAMDVLAALNIAAPAPVPVAQLPARMATPKPAISTRLAISFALAAFAFLLIGERFMPRPVEAPAQGVAVQSRSKTSPQAKPTVTKAPARSLAVPATLTVLERHAPPGRTCADVQFGAVAAIERPVAVGQPSALEGLCGLSLAVNAGERPAYVALGLDVLSGKLLTGTVEPPALAGQVAFTGRQEWAIDVPRRMHEPFAIRATVLASDQPLGEKAQVLEAAADKAAAAADLASAGISISSVQHTVLP